MARLRRIDYFDERNRTRSMRQRIRSGIILVVFLSFPITLNYLSPVVGLAGLAQRVIAGDLLLFGLQFLSALVLGRAWCGWACAAGRPHRSGFALGRRVADTGAAALRMES